jgi:Uma2 family endonuclease
MSAMGQRADEDLVVLPRSVVPLPLPLVVPPGFAPDNPSTWPQVEGRLEYLGGRLLFMPPCGDVQQDTVFDVAGILTPWVRAHPEFVGATNEAGMRFGDETRAADAAVWRRESILPYSGRIRQVPPVLAVEVAGSSDAEDETALRDKAEWYLGHGVQVVWLVLPEGREVVVKTRSGESRHRRGDRLPQHAALPDLDPLVDDFFRQLDA